MENCCFDCTHYDIIRGDYIEGWGYKWNPYCMFFDEIVEGLGKKAITCTKYQDKYHQEFRMEE